MCWVADDLKANRIEFTKEICKINGMTPGGDSRLWLPVPVTELSSGNARQMRESGARILSERDHRTSMLEFGCSHTYIYHTTNSWYASLLLPMLSLHHRELRH
jgi:hypothetical protein